MKILSVPQPYASYAVTGAISLLVVPLHLFDECELVIVSDARRTLPVAAHSPGLYAPNIVPELAELKNHALGVVDMHATTEPDESATGIPYMRGRCFLRISRPRIYAEPFAYKSNFAMQTRPVSFPDLWRDQELITLRQWRRRHPTKTNDLRSGPTAPSRDGWTGD
mgnify:CR=1 FL=1